MRIESITTGTFPYDREHALYQEYYRSALRSFCLGQGVAYAERSNSYADAALVKVRAVRHSYKLRKLMQLKPFAAFVDAVAGLLTRGPLNSPAPQGIYEVRMDSGESLSICIDAKDTGDINPALAATCDLYFKSNFWPSRTYPANVVPIPNMNPLVGRELPYFNGLRAVPKTTDLFAFFRVWGGTDEFEGIEHNLSLIESLAEARCTKYLCAYLVAGDIEALGKRLSDQGIEWTTEPMSKVDLWQRAAASRLNVVRLGMHECSPWRMIDILAMGGCPVIDYGPQTLWPSPLIEGHHYLNLDTPPGTPRSQEIASRIDAWLAEPGLVDAISRNTAVYFDQHLTPAALGESIATTIVDHAAGKLSAQPGGPTAMPIV